MTKRNNLYGLGLNKDFYQPRVVICLGAMYIVIAYVSNLKRVKFYSYDKTQNPPTVTNFIGYVKEKQEIDDDN